MAHKIAFALIVVAFVIAASATTIDTEFASFMVKYNKKYSVDELHQRIANFQQSKLRVQRLNAIAKIRGEDAQYGITKFADMTPEEFKQTRMGYKPKSNTPAPRYNIEENIELPTSLDWRTQGAVTPVKDQGQCGSCWAFSATEGVESGWFMSKKQLPVLSPQQVVSCDDNDDGCNGGDLPTAFAYIKSAGQESESKYPYTSGNGDTGRCKYNQAYVVAHITGFKYATQSMNETEMQVATIAHGPLSICVDAETWQDYTGGIVKSGCGTDLDHCVQIVGFNVGGQGTPYWTVRNSWNTDWGINGYIYVERNQDECGIAMEATYVTA
jgi:C1A family cysteine protease